MSEPVPYIERSRRYYEAQGFEQAYQWAHFEEVPFARLRQPVSRSRLGLITTAATYPRVRTDKRGVDTGSTEQPPARLYANDLFWDKAATHLDDLGSYFPLQPMLQAVVDGGLGSVSERFYCAPTSYSQRTTLTEDAPEILGLLREDAVDIALLVPL